MRPAIQLNTAGLVCLCGSLPFHAATWKGWTGNTPWGKVVSRHQGHPIGHGLRPSQHKKEEVAAAAGDGCGFNSAPCVTVAIWCRRWHQLRLFCADEFILSALFRPHVCKILIVQALSVSFSLLSILVMSLILLPIIFGPLHLQAF